SHPGALTGIALAAPAGFKFTTQEYGANGRVNDNTCTTSADCANGQTCNTTTGTCAGTPFISNFGGSSGAVAVVSGLAADVKSLYLARGDTWINNPGTLQTVMLAMTDRHFDTTSAQKQTGGDPIYGFGRVKLRRFGAAGATGADGAAGVSWHVTRTPSTT